LHGLQLRLEAGQSYVKGLYKKKEEAQTVGKSSLQFCNKIFSLPSACDNPTWVSHQINHLRRYRFQKYTVGIFKNFGHTPEPVLVFGSGRIGTF
jgi:hypothetical protein